MKINWFPGHMTKALRMMQEEIKNCDAVIYVLDSRAPCSSLNPSFIKIIGEKPVLYVLNKCDLVDEYALKDWQKHFAEGEKRDCIIMNATASGARNLVSNRLTKLLQGKIDFYKNKGANITLRVMIIGVPNSGKSTLANNLCGKGKAETGNRPGVTKSKQWVKISPYIELLDTPGSLWPNLEDEEVALHLAFIGSIKDEVLDRNELAVELIKTILHKNFDIVSSRYGVNCNADSDALEVVENIAIKKAFKLKGGDVDYDRVCVMILEDYKKGKLGKIVLDELK